MSTYNQPIQFRINPLNTSGESVAADTKPVASNFAARIAGITVPGTFAIGDRITGYGYHCTFTPSTTPSPGDIVVIDGTFGLAGETVQYRHTVTLTASDVSAEVTAARTAAENALKPGDTIDFVDGDTTAQATLARP